VARGFRVGKEAARGLKQAVRVRTVAAVRLKTVLFLDRASVVRR
jgi:hypothetical protein